MNSLLKTQSIIVSNILYTRAKINDEEDFKRDLEIKDPDLETANAILESGINI